MNYCSTHLKMLKRVLSIFLIWTFGLGQVMPAFSSNAYAQGMLPLPAPGTMMTMSPSFAPPIIRGITIYPDNPFRFDFIVDTGDHNLEGQALQEESTKMIKYFLASLTVPEDEFWVNLSPYEKDRIIPDGLGVTELGRDLLAQDYILKQITASLMYPEENLGSAFWKRVNEKAQRLYGTTDIPVNTFNKVWIIPDRAVVYEHERGAFVGERHLKVMLEEDYFALQEEMKSKGLTQGSAVNENKQADDKSSVVSEMIREVLIPELEKEVNEGEHFANLRQIFNSMILATWYKQVLKESLLGQIYVDQNKVKGVDVEDKEVKQKIYEQYVEAFKQGVYDYIKEDIDPVTQEMIPKRYFSGGIDPGVVNVKDLTRQDLKAQPLAEQEKIVGTEPGSSGKLVIVKSGATVKGQEVPAQPAGENISDEAMLTEFSTYEDYLKDFDEGGKLGHNDYPLSREQFWRAREAEEERGNQGRVSYGADRYDQAMLTNVPTFIQMMDMYHLMKRYEVENLLGELGNRTYAVEIEHQTDVVQLLDGTEDAETRNKKLMPNLAPFDAIESGLTIISNRNERKRMEELAKIPQEQVTQEKLDELNEKYPTRYMDILEELVAQMKDMKEGSSAHQDLILLAELANTTWKSRQTLERRKRDVFSPWSLLPGTQIKKDFIFLDKFLPEVYRLLQEERVKAYSAEVRVEFQRQINDMVDKAAKVMKQEGEAFDARSLDAIRKTALGVMEMFSDKARKDGTTPYFVHQLGMSILALDTVKFNNTVNALIFLMHHDTREDLPDTYDAYSNYIRGKIALETDPVAREARIAQVNSFLLAIRLLSKREGPSDDMNLVIDYFKRMASPKEYYPPFESSTWYTDTFIHDVQIVKLIDILFNIQDLKSIFQAGGFEALSERTKGLPQRTYDKLFLALEYFVVPSVYLSSQEKVKFFDEVEARINAYVSSSEFQDAAYAPLVEASKAALGKLRDYKNTVDFITPEKFFYAFELMDDLIKDSEKIEKGLKDKADSIEKYGTFANVEGVLESVNVSLGQVHSLLNPQRFPTKMQLSEYEAAKKDLEKKLEQFRQIVKGINRQLNKYIMAIEGVILNNEGLNSQTPVPGQDILSQIHGVLAGIQSELRSINSDSAMLTEAEADNIVSELISYNITAPSQQMKDEIMGKIRTLSNYLGELKANSDINSLNIAQKLKNNKSLMTFLSDFAEVSSRDVDERLSPKKDIYLFIVKIESLAHLKNFTEQNSLYAGMSQEARELAKPLIQSAVLSWNKDGGYVNQHFHVIHFTAHVLFKTGLVPTLEQAKQMVETVFTSAYRFEHDSWYYQAVKAIVATSPFDQVIPDTTLKQFDDSSTNPLPEFFEKILDVWLEDTRNTGWSVEDTSAALYEEAKIAQEEGIVDPETMAGMYTRDIVAILKVLKMVEVLEGSESRDTAMLSDEDLTRFKSYEEYRKDFDERQKKERILGGRGQDYPLSWEDFWRAKEEQDDAKMWSTDKAMLVKLTEGSIDKKGNNIVIKRPYAKSVSMSIEDAQEFVKDLIDQSKVLSPEFISFSLQVNSSRSSQAAAILSVLSHEAGLDDITTSEGFRLDYTREEYERVETVMDQSPNEEKLQAAKRFLNKFNRALNQIADPAMLTEVITRLEEIKNDISQNGEIYNRTAEENDYIAVSDERIEAMLESTRLLLKTATDELSRLRSLPKKDHDQLVAAVTGISGALSRYFTALDNLHALRNGLNAQRVFSREIDDKLSEISYAINDLKIKSDSTPISDPAMLTLKNDKRVVIFNGSDSFTIDDVLRTLEEIKQEATRSYERGGLVVFGTPSNARFLLMDMAQESGKFEGMWRDTHLDQWKIPGDQAESFRTWLNNQIAFLQEALTTKNIDALNAKEGFDLQIVSENRVNIPDGEKTYSASVKETIRVMEEIIASLTQQSLDKDGFVRYIAGDTKFVLMNAIEKSGKFGIRFSSHLQQWNVPKENIRSLRDWMQAELDMIKGSSDGAMLTSKDVGGIDFNPAMLEMQIKRDGNGLVLPVSEQPILNMNIEGLVPIIINVMPVTVPMLLGELEGQGPPAQLSRVN